MADSDLQALSQAGREMLERIEQVMAKVQWSDFVELTRMLPQARRTFVTGAGRSGLVARSFGMRLMHAGLSVFVPGETITPATGEGDLLVAISCTGQTGYTAYLADRAKRFGAKVVVVTGDPNSLLARRADKVIHVPADSPDIVIRAAVFEHATSLCLDAVFNVLAERLKFDIAEYRKRHANLE